MNSSSLFRLSFCRIVRGVQRFGMQVVDDNEIVEALETQDPIFVRPLCLSTRRVTPAERWSRILTSFTI